jgi:hypothetical protein
MAREKYVEIAPMISAQLEDEEIDLELAAVMEKPVEVVKPLTKEAVQEAIKYVKYLGAAVVPADGMAYVSHGFPDIANKVMAAGFDIDVKQVEEMYKEWKSIVQNNVVVEKPVVVEPIGVEPIGVEPIRAEEPKEIPVEEVRTILN